jgi:hypothetical protein
MGSQGLVFKDLLPLPDADPTEHEGTTTTLTDAPTESHALAFEVSSVAGISQTYADSFTGCEGRTPERGWGGASST